MESNNLQSFTLDQLKEEIKRREEEIRKSKIPQLLNNINFLPLIELVQEGIQYKENNGNQMKDFEHWIFECVMESFYGENVWEWWNK